MTKKINQILNARTFRKAMGSFLISLVAIASADMVSAQTTGLVSRWTADGNANDPVGGNNGTLEGGATFTPGVSRQAFLFDGIDDFVVAPATGIPTGNADRTIALWVRIDATVTNESFFAGYGFFGVLQGAHILGSAGANNRLFFSWWGADIPGPQLQSGRWYHVGVTHASGAVTLYLDGAPVGTGTLNISTAADSQFYIGRAPDPYSVTRRLQGAIDDVRVYNRALTATEIQAVYTEPSIVKPAFDFDGDGKTDIGIFRPAGSASEWWVNRSSTGDTFALQFGSATDRIAPADYTGDGKTDIAFFRPSSGEWFVLRSEDFSFFALPFGATGDVPVPADYDADGKADFAVFRPSSSTWFLSQSSGSPTRIQQFGITGDVPVVADYDADGKADVGIFRPAGAEWWIDRSTQGLLAIQFGASTDKPVQGDYSGDGKADVAIWRPSSGEWLIVRSEDFSFFGFPFGTNGDVPSPGDYDGDGKFDPTVFRPSSATWFIGRTTAGTQIVQFGATGDKAIPNAFVP